MVKYLRFIKTINDINGHFGLMINNTENTPNNHIVLWDGEKIFI